MNAGRAVLGAHAAQFHDRAAWHGEVGNPDVVVAVDYRCPRTRKATALEWRAGIWRAIWAQQCDAAAVHGASLLLGHGLRQVIRSGRNSFGLQAHCHVNEVSHAQHASAEPVGDPDVALAVDIETAVVDSGIEVLCLGWVGGGEAGNVRKAAIGNPYPVLLVDSEVERSHE